jgi:hypothetical protein
MAVPAPRLARANATSSRLGRVHTIRIPDSLWDIHVEQAFHEDRRDGVSEIVRDVMEVHARELLSAAGIVVDPKDPVTDEHAMRYGEVMAAVRKQQ